MNLDNIDRRDFLKIALASSFLGEADYAFSQEIKKPSRVLAAPSMTHVFIVVFLRGGADGLSILSPLSDESFMAARPPEMHFSIHSSSG